MIIVKHAQIKIERRENKRMKNLYIIGAGGCGRDIAWLVERVNEQKTTGGKQKEWELVGFIDNNPELKGKIIDGYEIIGDYEYLYGVSKDSWIVCGVANPYDRELTIKKLKNKGFFNFPVLIDPSAVISERSSIGEGTVVFANSFVSLDSFIKNHVLVGVGSTIGHDAIVEDYVSIYPGVHVSGNVHIKGSSELGSGSAIVQGITVGEQTTIGMCSSVIQNVPDCCTVIGNPAQVIYKHKKREVTV